MNDAHYHMLVNHFPIIGLFFGIAILVFGILKRNALLINTAYIIFIFCMIMGKITMMTGDKAEHFVENINGFSHDLIEEHEETAEGFMKIMYALGCASALGLYVDYKKHKKALLFSFLVLIIAVVAIILSGPVGTSGGEIRHTEIRKGDTISIPEASSKEFEKED
ncbi:hypothetical protein EQG63_06040 [Flavobacterium amnicola]|uniref:Uncharacterized protein n=1 Tax=Flavobacterium amnicola TaxID=2506422 RepID=A0A4Q1K377_9FLAO|nr:hypothetical protein [Flavobacterium amnicola]RXR19002.1 hypothetical protein EQG63_06040 [Flavobacterium amnicola]